MEDNEIGLAMVPNPAYVPEIKPGEADSMSTTVEEAIAKLAAEIAADEAVVQKKKETVNTLCGVLGRAPAYVIADANTVPTQIRSDQFYGQPLAASVRTILEMRKQRGLGAATNNEIYDALTAGGYEFDTKSEDIARKSLRNSLAKNTALFHKLPNGQFGLVSWYPNVKKPKAALPVEGYEYDPESESNPEPAPESTDHSDPIVAGDDEPKRIGFRRL